MRRLIPEPVASICLSASLVASINTKSIVPSGRHGIGGNQHQEVGALELQAMPGIVGQAVDHP